MKTTLIKIEIDRDKRQEIADKEIKKQPVSVWFVVSLVAFMTAFAVLIGMLVVG